MMAAVRNDRSKLISPVAFENSSTSTAARAARGGTRCAYQYQPIPIVAPTTAARAIDRGIMGLRFATIAGWVASLGATCESRAEGAAESTAPDKAATGGSMRFKGAMNR